MRKQLQAFVAKHFEVAVSKVGQDLREVLVSNELQTFRYVFSSERTEINGLKFGCDRRAFGAVPGEGDIYDQLDLTNNEFQQIQASRDKRGTLEERLGWELEQPFVLCQARNRQIVLRSQSSVPKERLIREVARRTKVVLLSFETGRHLDSYSRFDETPNCFRIQCRSFEEQACLIQFSRQCLFFTEGDFGSHIYVPPFLGKHVVAVAPRDIYELGTTPIEFWNKNVFKFGGQIRPLIAEQVFESESSLSRTADELLA
jgi:hypothetical protein